MVMARCAGVVVWNGTNSGSCRVPQSLIHGHVGARRAHRRLLRRVQLAKAKSALVDRVTWAYVARYGSHVAHRCPFLLTMIVNDASDRPTGLP